MSVGNAERSNDNSVSDVSKKSDEWDYDSIKKLSRRISKVNEKRHMIAIINIIETMNPTLKITVNDNGMFIKFNALAPNTYTKLENYLYKNLPKKQLDESESIQTSEYVPYSPDDANLSSDKYKLSNREKTLIKKQNYSQLVQ